MKKSIFVIFAALLFACNNNPKSENSNQSDTTKTKSADTTKTSADDQMQQDTTTHPFVDLAALPKNIDTTSMKDIKAEMRPVMFINQNANMTLLRWYYVGGNWQNQNCPFAQSCTNPDIKVCQKDPNTRRQIGSVPCGVTFTIQAVFFDKRIGRERNMEIKNTSVDCSKPAYNCFLGPEH